MSLPNKPLSQLTEADLQALIANQVTEGKTLDYKRDKLGVSDGDRREFLADVSAFANASGGDLVFGVEEAQGVATGLPGLAGVDPDAEILRLEQIARAGIRPPVFDLQCRAVRLANGNPVIAVRIPKSWNPPHQVVFQNAFRFYGRGSAGKYPLDVDELRSVFALSVGLGERIREFRAQRVARIVAGETPVRLNDGARIVLHFVPFSAFSPSPVADLTSLRKDATPLIAALGSASSRVNIDGLLAASELSASSNDYMQVFRNGCIETVEVSIRWEVGDGVLVLPHHAFEDHVVERMAGVKGVFQRIGVQPPVAIMLTLLGMSGWQMGDNKLQMRMRPRGFDRDPLLAPEALLETFDGEPEQDARPVIDFAWNAAGWPASPNYDDNGRWTLRSR